MQAEQNQNYEEAYGHYLQALEIFMYLRKCKLTLKYIRVLLDEKN